MECAVDHEIANYSYGTLYYGDIFRVVNNNEANKIAGIGVFGIDEDGAWVTPFLLHEEVAATMFAGYKNIWRGINVRNGNPTWTKISDNLGGNNSTNMRVLEQSPADVNILYAARENQTLFRSDNANDPGPDWLTLAGLPLSASINDLEAHPTNPDVVYLCQGTGVFKSSDRGVSWENIRGSLPEVTINDIAYYKNSNEGLYVGTDVGVFYKDAFLDDWIMFDSGFPASARVTEVEIYYDADNPAQDVIRAATYGRGLWSSDMYHTDPLADFSANMETVPPSCFITFTDLSAGVPTSWLWTFEGGNPSTSNLSNPGEIDYETPGSYDVSLSITNEFGTNTKIIENYIVVDETLLPEVDFTASCTILCSGEVIYFTDLSQYCPTQWEWNFDPQDVVFVENTSAQSQNPAVVFLSNANYSVTLSATSGNGTATLQKESFILSGGYPLPFEADFENGFTTQSWTIENTDNSITWEIVAPDWSPNGSKAAFMNFFGYTAMNQRDNLITPALNLDGIDNPHLMFNYAYTNRFAFRDSLIIKISDDCGETWQRIYANGPDGNGIFETTQQMTIPFNPSLDEHWCGVGYGADCISLNLAEFAGDPNVKIMFQSMNKYGNNLYIADVEITSPTEINSNNQNIKNFSIHPNPNNGQFTVLTNIDCVFDMNIYNAQGRIVKTGNISGNTRVELNSVFKGLYFVKISNNKESWLEKMIIQ